MKGRDVVHSSAKNGGSDDWCTPDSVLELVRWVFGGLGGEIGLDPATTGDNPTKAFSYCTTTQNGLSMSSWAGRGGVFLNPPHSAIRPWMAKAADEATRPGVEIIALVPVRTGARWWQESVAGKADAVCFWKGRLRFKGAPSSAPFDSAFVYYGDRAKAFRRVFEGHGWTVTLDR